MIALNRCTYCGGEINKTDITCKNCGASVAEMLHFDYNVQLPSAREVGKIVLEKKNATIGVIDKIVLLWIVSAIASVIFIASGIFIIAPLFIITAIIITVVMLSNKSNRLKVVKQLEGDATSTTPLNISIKCDDVKELNYKNSWWDDVNRDRQIYCPEGYISIAIHLIVKNHSNTKVELLANVVRLKVDGADMMTCPVRNENGFHDVVKEGEFLSFYDFFLTKSVPTIYPNTQYDGWVGFFIPPSSKRFEIIYCNETYIMDNPLNR
jgi:hypothetical protein